MNDLISRQALIEAIVNTPSLVQDETIPLQTQYDGATFRQIEIFGIIESMPPAQQWIPVKYRPMTEDEREYWSEQLGYDCEYEFGDNSIFDCQMPDDGQKILVCSKCGNIWIDTHEDDGGLMGLEENGDWEDIVAWMPRPKPYKGEE